MASQAEILEENRKVRRLQIVVDLVMSVIRQSELPHEEALELVTSTRQFALRLFPDKEFTYDLIYGSRFRRLLLDKYRMA
jgi:hypothetical protein